MMNGKKLVAYFSASGVTKSVASVLAKAANADLFEIEPEEIYTNADLDWMNNKSRSTIEMKNKEFRPVMGSSLKNAEEYDVIYLGFPIWWYVAPTIVNTFLERVNLEGKTIVVFATSGGSKFGNTLKELKTSCPVSTHFIEGKVFNTRTSEKELLEWVRAVDIS